VIKNVVVHVNGEQPVLVDLYDMPAPGDISLVCTNVRTADGKKPVFIDRTDSIFVFPYLHIRFVEIMAAAATGPTSATGGGVIAVPGSGAANGSSGDAATEEPDLELDEDFLRRIREV
jgi:hypothetical protein